MSWKDVFKNGFDRIYEIVKRKYPDIRFPCYGGRFYWLLWTRRFESLYFYLTQHSLIYTACGAYVTEIPFHEIRKISIKRGMIFKSSFRIRIVADKKYHLQINMIKDFSTKLTGSSANNVKSFIEMLQLDVEKQ